MPAPATRHGDDWLRDPKLREFATARQIELMDAVLEHRTMGAAAEALGIRTSVISEALKCAKDRAAAHGHAPGHWDSGVASGYRMGKVTVQRARDAEGNSRVERVWERQHPDDGGRDAAFLARVQALRDDLPRYGPAPSPDRADADLLTIYPQGDPHSGLYAWKDETGAAFDLGLYERENCEAIDRLVESAPSAEHALFIDLGDSTHADNNKNRTPRSGHELDTIGRHAEAMRVNMRVKRYQTKRLLEKHRRVTWRINPGNHDPTAALALALALEAAYENEPRVTIVTSPNPYWYHGFGTNLIGTCHGDGAKGKDLPLLMATDAPQLWAASEHGVRLWLVGHVHHKDVKDYNGATVEYCRTLAAPDAWAHGAGYRPFRSMEAITLHRTDGEVERQTCSHVRINRLLSRAA